MAVKTQGTELWFVNGASATKVGCVTTISGISSPRDQIETTCLEDDARSYVGGLQTPGTATFGINFDPSDASHTALETIYGANTTVWWILGWSDGTADPNWGASGGSIGANPRNAPGVGPGATSKGTIYIAGSDLNTSPVSIAGISPVKIGYCIILDIGCRG